MQSLPRHPTTLEFQLTPFSSVPWPRHSGGGVSPLHPRIPGPRVQSFPWESTLPCHSLGHIPQGLGHSSHLLGVLGPGQWEHGLLPVFQMQMAELLVSHGASLSARTSMDEMPIGKSSTTPGTRTGSHQLSTGRGING